LWTNEPDNPARGVSQGGKEGQAGSRRGAASPGFSVGAFGEPAAKPLTSGCLDRKLGRKQPQRYQRHPTRQLRRDHLPLLRQASRIRGQDQRAFITGAARFCAPSIWPGRWATPSRESCQSPSGTTSVHSTGALLLVRRRRIFRGIRGTTRTKRSRRCGSATLVNPDGRPYQDQ